MPYYINAYDVTDPAQNSSSTVLHDDILTSTDNRTRIQELTPDEVLYLTIQPVFVAGRFIHFLWYCVGFFGNAVSAILWLQPSLHEVCTSAQYLFAIAICDIICQILHFFYYLKVFWSVSAFDNTDLCEFWSLVYMVPQYVGQLLVVGYTIDKLISINNTFSGCGHSSKNRAAKIIVWIVITVTMMMFPQAYFWAGYCEVHRHVEYAIWNWLTLMVVYIVTPLVILGLNCRIIYVFKNPEQYLLLNQSQAEFALQIYSRFKTSLRESIRILVTLSFMRVILTVPDTLMRCLLSLDYFEAFRLPPVFTVADVESSQHWMRFVRFSSVRYCFGFFTAAYLALSVVVYCVASPTFRNELKIRMVRVRTAVIVFFHTYFGKFNAIIQSLRDSEE